MTYNSTCCGCQNQLPTTRYILDNQQAMCPDCVDIDDLHKQVWPDCQAAWHQPLDHLTDIRFNGGTAL